MRLLTPIHLLFQQGVPRDLPGRRRAKRGGGRRWGERSEGGHRNGSKADRWAAKSTVVAPEYETFLQGSAAGRLKALPWRPGAVVHDKVRPRGG